MEAEALGWLTGDHGYYVYLGVFSLLILGGLWLPIPEDIPIILGGVAAAKGVVSLPGILLTGYCGVILADQLVYLSGYLFGERLLIYLQRSKLFPSITRRKIQSMKLNLRRKRFKYIFLGRVFFPVRSITFAAAGSLRIPVLEFFLSDAIAAVISVTLVTLVGYYAGASLTPELTAKLVDSAHTYLLWLALALLAAYLLKKKVQLSEERLKAEQSADEQ